MSALEDELALILDAAGIGYVREYRLCAWRWFRADFLVMCAGRNIVVEVQGHGPQGRHGSWGQMESDCAKISLATCLGYRTLTCTAKQVRDGSALLWIEVALGIKPVEALQAAYERARATKAKKTPRRSRRIPAPLAAKRRGGGLPERVRKAAGL